MNTQQKRSNWRTFAFGFLAVAIGSGYFFNTQCTNKVLTAPTNKNMAQDTTKHPFPNFSLKALDGAPLETKDFAGKKIVILNVASECGYTPQYADWQKFYEANKAEVVVIGFPCNDFGGQEPGSVGEIQQFCQKNYGVTFPIAEKVSVKGNDQSPVYQWFSTPALNGWNDQVPSWNFCKYLIDEEGKLVGFYASNIKPDSEAFLKGLGM
jgi:glutathione peroxidase